MLINKKYPYNYSVNQIKSKTIHNKKHLLLIKHNQQKNSTCRCLRTWTLLLSLEQGDEWGVGDLDNLETNTGNITDGVTRATKTGDQDFIVFLKEIYVNKVKNKKGAKNFAYYNINLSKFVPQESEFPLKEVKAPKTEYKVSP